MLRRAVSLPIGNFMAWNLRLERGECRSQSHSRYMSPAVYALDADTCWVRECMTCTGAKKFNEQYTKAYERFEQHMAVSRRFPLIPFGTASIYP